MRFYVIYVYFKLNMGLFFNFKNLKNKFSILFLKAVLSNLTIQFQEKVKYYFYFNLKKKVFYVLGQNRTIPCYFVLTLNSGILKKYH